MNLKLRKQALEADGWTSTPYLDSFMMHELDCIALGSGRPNLFSDCREGCAYLPQAPAVESDPGLSEPWFLEWCEKNKANWKIHDYFADVYHIMRYFICTIWLPVDAHSGFVYEQRGVTPSEARAKAVVETRRHLK